MDWDFSQSGILILLMVPNPPHSVGSLFDLYVEIESIVIATQRFAYVKVTQIKIIFIYF